MVTTLKSYLDEQMRDPEFAAAYQEIDAEENRKLAEHFAAEHERLKQAAVEAAQAERVAENAYWQEGNSNLWDSLQQDWDALRAARRVAVDALNKYEAEMNSEV